MPVLNSIELEGVSSEGWGDAARDALREAAKTLRNIRRMEVLSTSATIGDGGTITEYRAQVRLVFEVERQPDPRSGRRRRPQARGSQP